MERKPWSCSIKNKFFHYFKEPRSAFNKIIEKIVLLLAGMRIRIWSDPVIFGPPDPDPVLFSIDQDPDPDPTCNNGFIKLFLS